MDDLNILLAKSNPEIKLLNHSRNVSAVATQIAKIISPALDDETLKIIRISGLCHDIGKITELEQNKLKGKKAKKQVFYHNELGWAFVQTYIKYDIGYFVYWHHNVSRMNKDTSEEILNSVSSEEIEAMKLFAVKVLGNDCFRTETIGTKKTPKFYDIENNEIYKSIFIRLCVISADRIVSELEEENNPELLILNNELSTVIENKIIEIDSKINNFLIKESVFLNKKRFEEQKNIVAQCKKTTIIKATAGFGKTIIGILFSLLNKKKTIWVCPRNAVSQAVYDQLIGDLELLGLTNVSVELYLTGEVKKSNGIKECDFNSDIIITNIDNFLAPSFKDKIGDKLFLISSANVIFDEYHELITSNNAIFSCFIEIMKMRHRMTNNKTLLLSATPILLEGNCSWDSLNNITTILPNKENHYPAIHQTKYKIKVLNDFELTKELELNSNLFVLNSITESQRFKKQYSDSTLYHSKFNEDSKIEKYEYIIENFGKKRIKNIKKQTVISAPVIQASFDVSFKNLAESVQSPEATLQRIGRCNRFDDFIDDDRSIIYCFKLQNRNKNSKSKYSLSEKKSSELFYSNELTNLWFDELLRYNNKELTLDELYKIYNNHVLKYAKERNKFFNLRRMGSREYLENIFPKFYYKKNIEDDEKPIPNYDARGNKLRCTGNEIFFIAKINGSESEYSDAFSVEVHSTFEKEFNETRNIETQMIKEMRKLEGDERFDYTDILNSNKGIDTIREQAKMHKTPYIRFDVVYDPIYGIISKEKLFEFEQ